MDRMNVLSLYFAWWYMSDGRRRIALRHAGGTSEAGDLHICTVRTPNRNQFSWDPMS